MSGTYPDRRAELFGREPDIHFLCDRARHAGLTVVAARPLMGKTWTLVEVARRLEEEGTFIVGYHESKGAESSHLLYAVASLYTRWLDDSRMWDQARSLWERHKDGLVPRIGQAVGSIFEKLGGKLLPEGVAAIVQKAFDGLAQAQDDLLKGGLQLAPLPYDEALALTNLVATLSGKRVVLILDAWEKSPSIAREFATLESFAKNPGDWPDAHLMLAVRNPEVDSTKLNDEALRRAKDLCKVSSAAKVHELPPMDRADPKEQARIVGFVRAQVPAAKDASDERIVDMIDGYPGVLGFWLNESTRGEMRTPDDLRDQAGNAQALRYLELDHLLGELKESSLSFAARLTVFPRLDAAGWKRFAAILLADGADDPFYTLVDGKILLDEPFPTFGHDTRYVAARRWFVENQKPLLRRLAGRIVDRLAIGVDGVEARNRPFFEALVGCSDAAKQLALDGSTMCLIAAARSMFGDHAGMFDSDFRADCEAALEREPKATALVALALFNRALENGVRGDVSAEVEDYGLVIGLPDAPLQQRAKALTNRGVERAKADDSAGALADFDAALGLPGIAPADIAQALANRGLLRELSNDVESAIADYTRVVEIEQASVDDVVMALIDRAKANSGLGNWRDALDDTRFVVSMPAASAHQVSFALLTRSVIAFQHDALDTAIADATSLIDWPAAAPEHVVSAHLNRGMAKAQAGDAPGARADFDAVLQAAAATPDDRVKACMNRGMTWDAAANAEAAERDFAAAMAVPGASRPLLAMTRAYLARSRLAGQPAPKGFDPLNRAPDTP